MYVCVCVCSAESGFSDEKGDDTDEEEGTIEGRIRHGPRRRTRKVRDIHTFESSFVNFVVVFGNSGR